MDPSQLKLGDLRISTMVVTAHLGTTIQLQKLLDLFHEVAIPLTWPAEGFLKVEYKPIFLPKENATAIELQKAKLNLANQMEQARKQEALPKVEVEDPDAYLLE